MVSEELKHMLKKEFENAEDKVSFLNEIRKFLHSLSPFKHNPCDLVLWVKLENVKPNDYNPNVVPKTEFRLLYHSIKKDGYTMPIVAFDNSDGTFTIIDGYHRYLVSKTFDDIKETNKGFIPISLVFGKNREDKIASTIRHNRARGQHQIVRMPSIILDLLKNWNEEKIVEELGVDKEEIERVKIFTGYSSFFKNHTYNKAWIPRFVLEKFYKDIEKNKN